MKENIFLIGVGNYTEVIIELAKDCGYKVKGLYHYNKSRNGETIFGIPILGSTEDLFTQKINNVRFAVTIGDNNLRSRISSKIIELGGVTPSLIHPKSKVSISAKIGSGCFIHMEAMVWTSASVGDYCILSPYSQVSHHAKIDLACFITTYSIVGAYCSIGKRVLFGLNSITVPNVTIGDDCVIGSKSNVLRDFGNDKTLIGNPAKEK